MLIEATLPRPERTGERGHLTPREAGQLGRSARAQRLVVTHYSDELDAGWLRSEAVGGYGADVELAEEGSTYNL
jgi:ribonuclease BN (tRNA processing enzyme)